jgi:succinate dehydrogenase / fumarate reductase, cytochrome b subunit
MSNPGRPLSPHVQVWRWHITMLSSILHRMTGMALYAGALILAWWAVALASGPYAYDQFLSLAGSPLGLVALFGLTLSLFFHLANGVRHLIWDTGRGLEIKSAGSTAAAALAFAAVASVGLWAAFLLGGR